VPQLGATHTTQCLCLGAGQNPTGALKLPPPTLATHSRTHRRGVSRKCGIPVALCSLLQFITRVHRRAHGRGVVLERKRCLKPKGEIDGFLTGVPVLGDMSSRLWVMRGETETCGRCSTGIIDYVGVTTVTQAQHPYQHRVQGGDQHRAKRPSPTRMRPHGALRIWIVCKLRTITQIIK
jgi:hypothetical protein